MSTSTNINKLSSELVIGQRFIPGQPQIRLLEAVIAKDIAAAERTVNALINSGMDGSTLFREIFQPLFQQLASYISTDKISNARGNVSSEIAFQLLRGVADKFSPKSRSGSASKLVIGCLKGEPHDIGCRIVASLFEMAGWDVSYLGNEMDQTEFLNGTLDARPDLVGISASNLLRVPAVKELIVALHECEIGDKFKIMVGGYPFSINPKFATDIGADFTARSAAEAVSKARRYVSRSGESIPAEVITFVV